MLELNSIELLKQPYDCVELEFHCTIHASPDVGERNSLFQEITHTNPVYVHTKQWTAIISIGIALHNTCVSPDVGERNSLFQEITHTNPVYVHTKQWTAIISIGIVYLLYLDVYTYTEWQYTQQTHMHTHVCTYSVVRDSEPFCGNTYRRQIHIFKIYISFCWLYIFGLVHYASYYVNIH